VTVDLEFGVDISGPNRLLNALAITLGGSRLMYFHEAVTQEWLRRRASERFASEGDSAVGGSWQQLTDSRNDIREHAGFPREHPINHATGELEDFITKGANQMTYGALWSSFLMPGRTRKKSLVAKMEAAQRGRPAGSPMPDGWGGSKPSPSATPPRPVIGMDEIDRIHLTTALSFWVIDEVGKLMGFEGVI
jgi:hypothetical protein